MKLLRMMQVVGMPSRHGGLELGAVVEEGAVAADGDYRALGRGELSTEAYGIADADGGESLRAPAGSGGCSKVWYS